MIRTFSYKTYSYDCFVLLLEVVSGLFDSPFEANSVTNSEAQIKSSHAELLVRCFDFSPPPGWLKIVNSLLKDTAQILRDAKVPLGVFSVRQIKEKFGGLRVYVDGFPETATPLNLEIEWDPETEVESTPLYREWHFERVCSIQFDERIDNASVSRILAAISAAAYLPAGVARQIANHIDRACDLADRSCQLCGAEGGRVVDNGWYMTVCAEHRNSAAREAWWKEREAPQ